MSSPHTLITKFKPRGSGTRFQLFEDSITYGGPHPTPQTLDSVTVTLVPYTKTDGEYSASIEIKSGATWTAGVLTVNRHRTTKASAFKDAVDAAVIAYVP